MLHGEFGRGGAPYEDGGTVDAVVAQKIPVGDAFPHRDDFSHGGAVCMHQLPGRAAQDGAGLLYFGKLLCELSRRPPVVGIQEGDKFSGL